MQLYPIITYTGWGEFSQKEEEIDVIYLINERLNNSFVDVELDTFGPKYTVELVRFGHIGVEFFFHQNFPGTGQVNDREGLLVPLSLVERTTPCEHLDVLTNILLPSFTSQWRP